MNRIAMSAAASGLLRALIARADVNRDRVLLTDIRSEDWQSLTLVGERHQLRIRVTGPDAPSAVERLCTGLEDAEFTIPSQIVADIAVAEQATPERDGSISVAIEALTIGE